MILADTSAWVELDRATGSAVDLRLTDLIASNAGLVAVTEPVIAEVAIGARTDEREVQLRRLLARFHLLRFEISDFDAAASIYRRCRKVGVSPRGLVDCMIAAVAWRHGATLLAQDVDLRRIAAVVGIDLDGALSGA
ncbi:MAG TPA: PIN domain nuclease [Acidimicrobiales bacterium]|nr:PIN domain nuclease [Acidimicrobiales bacterium]